MKKNCKIKVIIILLVSFNFLSGAEPVRHSIIKLQRKDTYFSEKYRIFDNQKFVGEISNKEFLNWKRNPGMMEILIEREKGLKRIEIKVDAGKIYEIEIYPNKYSSSIFALKEGIVEKPKRNLLEYLVPFVIFLVILISILTLYFHKKRIEKLLILGKDFTKKEEYEQALEIFQKLVKIKANHLAAWQELEIVYLKKQEFDKAYSCRKKIRELLENAKFEKKDFSEIRVSDIDLSLLVKLLKIEIPEIEKINIVRSLKQGFSGSSVFLAEVIQKEDATTNFAVLKIDKNDAKEILKSNLQRESAGFAALKQNRIEEIEQHLPQRILLFTESELVSNNRSLLFSTFAGEKNTQNVMTLRESLQKKYNLYFPEISRIRDFYEKQFFSIPNNKKRFLKPVEHLKNMLEFKTDDILKFKWERMQIQKEKQFINIEGKLFPNIIFYLENPDFWTKDGFSTFYFIVHGDLNLDNIIFKSDRNFVLIDFEKVRETVIHFDLTFLICWFAQVFMLETSAEKDWNSILNFIPQIISYLKNPPEEINSQPATENFKQILAEIYPFKRNLDENSKKSFHLSLTAASLLRSFYEMRDFERSSLKNLKNKKNGLFFYALACQLLADLDFIMIKNASTKDAFDLPEL